MLLILAVTIWLFKASSSQITNYGNKTAEYGGEAHYSCVLADPTGVRQVTWQRLSAEQSVENLATYSQRFGQQVNKPYQDKVAFTEATLSSTAITVRNVTWRDQSCYVCSFNVFPDGSVSRQTCLTVQGISEANASAQIQTQLGEAVLTCSATGKPAPTIHWELPTGTTAAVSPERTQTVSNGDRTFTSSSSVTLKVSAPFEGHADCVLNRGTLGQRTERIPLLMRTTPVEKGMDSSSSFWPVAMTVCVVLVIICALAAVIALRHKRWKLGTRNITIV